MKLLLALLLASHAYALPNVIDSAHANVTKSATTGIGIWQITDAPAAFGGLDVSVTNTASNAVPVSPVGAAYAAATNTASQSTKLDAILGALTFTASGYISVSSSSATAASWTALAIDVSVSAGSATTGPYYIALSCTDTAATLWWFAGTLAITALDNDYYSVYAGGTLKIYELPFKAGEIIRVTVPPGVAPRRFAYHIYTH